MCVAVGDVSLDAGLSRSQGVAGVILAGLAERTSIVYEFDCPYQRDARSNEYVVVVADDE
jgi:hypothetical protein